MSDHECCARCGFDHEYEPAEAQAIHSVCPLCQREIDTGRIGEGPDHDCLTMIRDGGRIGIHVNLDLPAVTFPSR